MDTVQTRASRSGAERANRLIDELRPQAGNVSASFARIIVGLFPEWFDFAPGQFTVMTWERGLKLVVSGTEPGVVLFPTSDSRCMSCIYVGEAVEVARMDMHYKPEPQQVERARAVISLALHRLFPARGPAPTSAELVVPPGRVFPREWSGWVADAEPKPAPDRGRAASFWDFMAFWRSPRK